MEKEIKDSTDHSQGLNQVLSDTREPILVEVELETQALQTDLDTGATVSLISEQTYQTMFPDTLQETKTTFKTYSRDPLRVVGQRDVRVVIAGQTAKLPLTAVAGNGPILLGRNWLQIIRFDLQRIYHVKQCKLSGVLDWYQTLFQPGLGMLEGYEAKIVIIPEARPRFCRARSVPYAMQAQVEKELNRLQA